MGLHGRTDNSRFLKESGAMDQMSEVLDLGLKAYELCPEDQKDVLAKDHLYNSAGAMYLETGFFDKAEPYLRECLRVRLEIYGQDHEEIGNTYNNLGLNSGSQGRYEEYLSYMKECERICLLEDELEISDDRLPVLNLGLGRALLMVGDIEGAEERYKSALAQLQGESNWYWKAQ